MAVLLDLVEGAVKARRPLQETVAALAKAAEEKVPFLFDAKNYPNEFADAGFSFIPGLNYADKTGLKKLTASEARKALELMQRNIGASVDMDPKAAEQYARFYYDVRDGLQNVDRPLPEAAGVWASFSPRKDPVKNWKLMTQFYENPATNPGHTGDNYQKALRIVAGDNPLDAGVLGMKQRSFASNSMNPSGLRDVTIDTHASQNALGLKPEYDMIPNLQDPYIYDMISEAFRREGVKRGMTPSELQAAAWGNWRERYGAGVPTLPDFAVPEALQRLSRLA